MDKRLAFRTGILFIAFVLPLTVFSQTFQSKKIMPNVVGMPLERAKMVLTQAGITGFGARPNPTKDQGQDQRVFAQNPMAGKPLEGAPVIDYYRYEAPATMPSVIGQNLEETGKALSSRGYIVKYEYAGTNNQGLNNKIFAQAPNPGSPLPPTQTILLKAYKYESGVAVPNVMGLHLVNALDLLNKTGLRYTLVGVQEPKTPQQQGTVFSQDPAAGAQVSKGSVVKMVMYKDTLPVPRVIGMKLTEAIKAIETAGYKPPQFNPDFLKVPPPIYLKVASQNPAAGQKLPYGSWISLDVKALALMPNVIGMDYERAKATIKGMNVQVGAYELRQVSTSDPTQRNKVFNQDPPAGAEIVVGPGPIYRFPGNPRLGVYK